MKKSLILLLALALPIMSPAYAQDRSILAVDQALLLESTDQQLAANKQLVYNMYREVLQGGQISRIEHYFTEGYIQHNPNVVSGRDALFNFVKNSRPALEVKPTLELPLISIIAERDQVMLNFERREKQEDGETYYTTWFDMFRIEDGRIAEHWDPALKSPAMLTLNPNESQGLETKPK